MTFKKILGLVLMLVLVLVTIAFKTGVAKAAKDDGVDLGISIQVSTDNGQTWQGYSPGGQVANPCQGQEIYIRTNVWNQGSQDASMVTGVSNWNDQSFMASTSIGNSDVDDDGIIFDRTPFVGNGAFYIPAVRANTNEQNGESVITHVDLANICPSEPLLIIGTVGIQNYNVSSPNNNQIPDGQPGQLMMFGFGRAMARGIGQTASFALTVCGCSNQSQTVVVTTLPQTGGSLIGNFFLAIKHFL